MISHRHVRPEIIVYLCFLTPKRMTGNTGRGSLVTLDKLNLSSNSSLYSMVSLHLSLL